MHLLVTMYHYRGRHTQITFGEPLPDKPLPPKPVYKNIVAQALKVRDYLSQDPQRSYFHAGGYFHVSRARISQLMKIINNLPPEFVSKIGQTDDQALLHRFSGKTLLGIAGMSDSGARQAYIQNLLETIET